ncbi:response regulator transcription factor [Lachnoclostridium sp. Marseille-P6806]|uniref:response regulator transcription factor n=1 Tax=Lachnoclostridium sp. Marseille-P6806 TaxID=2364793 RepID=UPI0013EF1131|nr:response regulator [Lachnoclostridium sp. Marseille-P6806]
MNLLIADDEKLTREGIQSGMDYGALGFYEVRTADDGRHGLEVCADFAPDVVLTDVRMPRMDGIQMAERLQEMYPDIAIVFMSGYSDKEYLKAAIRLRAVSYVEKPIVLDEVRETLKEAAQRVRAQKRERQHLSDELRSRKAALAVRLTKADKIGRTPADELEEIGFRIPASQLHGCLCVLFPCYGTEHSQEEAGRAVEKLDGSVEQLCRSMRLERLYAIKDPSLFLYLFFSRREMSDHQLALLGSRLTGILCSSGLRFHIVMGRQVDRPEQLYASYNSAIIRLQRAFFIPENSCLPYRETDGRAFFSDLSGQRLVEHFQELVLEQKQEAVDAYLDQLLEKATGKGGSTVLPGQLKDICILMLTFLDQRTALAGAGSERDDRKANWNQVSACVSVYGLRDLMHRKTDRYFQALRKNAECSPVVALIRSYVAECYSDPALSIKAISEYVHLSSSYICTLFRNETGKTLNQHITECRLERAKELLADPRNRIADISSVTGFSDSNYFSKLFRKKYGCSPSEFRES